MFRGLPEVIVWKIGSVPAMHLIRSRCREMVQSNVQLEAFEHDSSTFDATLDSLASRDTHAGYSDAPVAPSDWSSVMQLVAKLCLSCLLAVIVALTMVMKSVSMS